MPRLPETLTSTRNPRVQAALALRERRGRDASGLTLVDGTRELARALAGGTTVVEVFVEESRLDVEAATVVAMAAEGGATVVAVTTGVFRRLAYGDRAEGVVATVAIPERSLASLRLPDQPLVIVIEALEKPGNLGAVLRSADAAGADAVVVADAVTDLFNPNAIRASLGTIFTVPVVAATSADGREWLAARAIRMLAARVGAPTAYTDVDLRGPVAIVLGSESDGLTDAWSGSGVTPIALPMLGVADSLNVSVTAAVLLYEARRQRGSTKPG